MTAKIKDAVRRYELVVQVLEELMQESDCGAVIVVEGKNDVSALRNLGIRGTIKSPSGQSLLHFVDTLAYDHDHNHDHTSVIILTDWDRKGDELSSRIATYLQAHGTTPDTALRARLKKLVRKDIKDVQGLDTYLLKLRQGIIKYVR